MLAQLAAGKHCKYLPTITITNTISYALTNTDLSTFTNADTNTDNTTNSNADTKTVAIKITDIKVLAQLAAGKHCEYLPTNTITNTISSALTNTVFKVQLPG